MLNGPEVEMWERLLIAAEYRDGSTCRHTTRVGEISARLGAALGMTDDEAQILQRAAALHDVGKVGIPDALLLKPGQLTAGRDQASPQFPVRPARGRCVTTVIEWNFPAVTWRAGWAEAGSVPPCS